MKAGLGGWRWTLRSLNVIAARGLGLTLCPRPFFYLQAVHKHHHKFLRAASCLRPDAEERSLVEPAAWTCLDSLSIA
jgi:hypothetical protein